MHRKENGWYPTVNEDSILGFFREYRFLSNFHLCNIDINGIIYPSAENAYMSLKTNSLEDKKNFARMTPKEAKSFGKTVTLIEGWSEYRLPAMEMVLEKKFSIPYLTEMLLSTGDKYLEETNYWRDTFWGVCKDVGENNLGKILMKIRDQKALQRGLN
jgi:hypothetical protein